MDLIRCAMPARAMALPKSEATPARTQLLIVPAACGRVLRPASAGR